MPKLGADMAAGTLVAWRKQPGDVVARGDIIAEVETDKGVIDVEVFTSGVLEKLLVAAGREGAGRDAAGASSAAKARRRPRPPRRRTDRCRAGPGGCPRRRLRAAAQPPSPSRRRRLADLARWHGRSPPSWESI